VNVKRRTTATLLLILLLALVAATGTAAAQDGQPPAAAAPARTPAIPTCSIFAGTPTISLDSGAPPLANGAFDPRWTILSDPFSTTTKPRPALVVSPPNVGWKAPLPGSQWISSDPGGAQGVNGPYMYQFCFCLADGFSKPVLQLALRADDQANVYLNGLPPGATPILTGAVSSFKAATPDVLTLSDPTKFVLGKNCVNVQVNNLAGVDTGLDITGSMSATRSGGGGGLLPPGCCQATGTICGTKFEDTNDNHVQDAGEPVLTGWPIQLSGPISGTVLTDSFGEYCFSGLPPGNYQVTEGSQPGWTETFPNPATPYAVTLAAGETVGPLSFGNFCKPGGRFGACLRSEPLCTLLGGIRSSCCLGPAAGAGTDAYSFYAKVALGNATGCTFTLTSTTSGLTVASYGPTTLAAGNNVVTGTFTAPAVGGTFNLTVRCAAGIATTCSQTFTAALPACP
jgi:hypothetical protein